MGRTLNIPDPQVLIHYSGDANGYFHHRRLPLHKIGSGHWLALTPDLDLEVQDLSSTRHRVGPSRAELDRQKRLARTMGAILDDSQVVNVDEQQWYVVDPSILA